MKEIERTLGVARSSVSLWVRDVTVRDEVRRSMLARGAARAEAARIRMSENARARRRQYQEAGRRLARERDGSYAAGCMLYWAEGSKERNSVIVSNSDPELIGFFARFLREQFEVSDDRFRVLCNLFADHLERRRD